ncbi:hypothetical protein Aros01_04291 [Streptosporangium roseum]
MGPAVLQRRLRRLAAAATSPDGQRQPREALPRGAAPRVEERVVRARYPGKPVHHRRGRDRPRDSSCLPVRTGTRVVRPDLDSKILERSRHPAPVTVSRNAPAPSSGTEPRTGDRPQPRTTAGCGMAIAVPHRCGTGTSGESASVADQAELVALGVEHYLVGAEVVADDLSDTDRAQTKGCGDGWFELIDFDVKVQPVLAGPLLLNGLEGQTYEARRFDMRPSPSAMDGTASEQRRPEQDERLRMTAINHDLIQASTHDRQNRRGRRHRAWPAPRRSLTRSPRDLGTAHRQAPGLLGVLRRPSPGIVPHASAIPGPPGKTRPRAFAYGPRPPACALRKLLGPAHDRQGVFREIRNEALRPGRRTLADRCVIGSLSSRHPSQSVFEKW